MKTEIKINNRRSAFVELKDFCYLTNKDSGDFIEVTEWTNGEGFDVTVSAHKEQQFTLTWGEYRALKKLIKILDDE